MTAPSTPTDLITLTIDDREVQVPRGTLVVEAARQLGIEIPVFCYHPKLKPVGACRMCLVEIEKMPRLQTACTSPVSEGMVVHTNTQNVIGAQNGVLELMLANHPLDCPICDKGGECPLQDNTFKFGLGTSRFTEEKRQLDKAFPLSERIVLDRERCIMCYRCTRFQAEIAGDEALAAVDRGGYSEIGVLEGETFDSPFSGNTIELCPVGALTSRQYRFKARPWDLQRTPSTCAGCGVGCNVELHARDGRIVRMLGRDNREVNDGWLCDYGRFDTLPPLEGRVARPLLRNGGALEPTTWDRAYARAAEVLRDGPTGLLASPALTSEAIWLFADALRAALPAAHAGFWPRAAAPWPLRGAIKDLPACKTFVLVGLDPWLELPVLALWIRKAVLNGATLIAIGPDNGLYRDTAHWLRVPFGTEVRMVQRLLEAADRVHSTDNRGGVALSGRAAQAGREADDAAIEAAARALGSGPAALLIHPRLTTNRSDVGLLERLAEQLGAGGEGGMVGSPPLAANGRGALELAADIATVDPKIGAVATRAAADELRAILLVGHERWPTTGRARQILVTWGPIDEQAEDVEVVLPMAHPYEQAGSLTNLEGRVQLLQAGGLPPIGVPPDWQLLADLVTHLGGAAANDLRSIRTALAEAHPKYRAPEVAAGGRDRISLAVV
ncbi:MAG: NADH-quinone oxidoreductase subunit NuoG [Chloroflexi bacterium]|nr:NADH-quinone oxidoreductase subunit NuoG [Chloroflexota bacterium]